MHIGRQNNKNIISRHLSIFKQENKSIQNIRQQKNTKESLTDKLVDPRLFKKIFQFKTVFDNKKHDLHELKMHISFLPFRYSFDSLTDMYYAQ